MNKRLLREFYLLPRGEQRAMVMLSFLLVLGIVARVVVQFLPGREPPGMEEFERESRAFFAALEQSDSLEKTTSFSQGDSMQVKSPFYLSNRPQKPSWNPVLLNRVDSLQLLPLPGIGPVFAGRIIKYRNLLGGFVSSDQLLEVYGLKEETLQLIQDYLVIDTLEIEQLDLNSATFRELLRHPYLQLEDVKALIRFRDFSGTITSLHELRQNHILSDSLIDRIGPYLTCDPQTIQKDDAIEPR